MGQFQPKSREAILERMVNRVVARTALNDLNDGSSVKQVLAAAAREDDDQYFQMINLLNLFDINKAIGGDLDERAKEFNPALISRRQALKATGEVVFSRVGTTGTVTIPLGTQVQVPASGAQDAIVFVTTEEATITAGNTTSGNTDISADVAGESGNAAVGTITSFVSKPSGVDFVTNPVALTNGRELESDDDFRERLKRQIAGLARSHVTGLESAALAVEDTGTGKRVVFAQVEEDQINRGNVTVYVDDGSGTAETTASQTGVTVLASAVGGETVIFLSDKPIKIEETFVLRRNTVPLVKDTDYTLNPASGQINFLPGPFPSGLTATDAIDADYTYFTGLIALTQKTIDGDPGDRANFPGFRAGGVLVRVLTPTIVQQSVTANITVLAGFNQTTVASQVTNAISSYINALGIGDDVILNEIRERAMAVAGMFDIQVAAPTSNQIILDGQLARIISTNISIT